MTQELTPPTWAGRSGSGLLEAGSTMYPQRAVLAEYPAGAVLLPRVIDDWELVWMLRGRSRFHTDGSDPGGVQIERHDMLVVPPGVTHSFVWDPLGPTRHGYLHFRALDRSGQDITAPSALVRPRAGLATPLAELTRFLVWLSDCQLPGRQARTAEVLRLQLGLLIDGPLPTPTERTAPAVVAALEHLARRWAQMPLRPISVSELAGAAGISDSHLHRLFVRAFTISPSAAMELLRLSRATSLLDHTGMTIETIASLCGFADAAHLSHRFKAVCGSSPTAHRAGDEAMVLPPGVQRIAQILWD